MTTLSDYINDGWSVIPIDHKSKNPNRPGWQSATFKVSDFPTDRPHNIGVHLGERSGNLTDVDLDHAYAVALAPDILPPTPAVFGRQSKPRSHWLYKSTSPIQSKPYKSKDHGTIIEIRASGQTVFPPSTHPSGESIEWDEWPATPAPVDPADLREAVEQIHRAALAWLEMDKIGIADGKDGSRRLHTCACRCVEHDLTDETAVTVIRHYAIENPFPRDWTDEEILQRVHDAEGKTTRGSATGTAKLPLPKCPPEVVADHLVEECFTLGEVRTLHSLHGDLLAWDGDKYNRLSSSDSRNLIRRHAKASYTNHTRNAIASVKDALIAETALPVSFTIPGWHEGDGPTKHLFPCKSGLVDLQTGDIQPPTPEYINAVVSPIEWQPDAEPPEEWCKFLSSVWPDDAGARRLLRQWFGYILTPDTRQQKMLLMVGPKRSGKGTVARTLRELIGPDSVAGPTLASMSENFGLQPLLDKTLAIVADARLSTRNDNSRLVERLLSISGEDPIGVHRKFQDAVTLILNTRIMVMTNEIPRLADPSGALANRFIILPMENSFFGKEDVNLMDKLRAELPGILQWAYEGWKDLQAVGRFTIPASTAEVLREIEDLSSPIGKFLREYCEFDRSAETTKQALYEAYADWCQDVEHIRAPSDSSFGKMLKAATPFTLKSGRTSLADGSRPPTYVGIRLTRPVLSGVS